MPDVFAKKFMSKYRVVNVDASDMEVTVQSGEVTLMGLVDERNAKRRAEDIGESVSGVTRVEIDSKFSLDLTVWIQRFTDRCLRAL